jgi:hypothetical protein
VGGCRFRGPTRQWVRVRNITVGRETVGAIRVRGGGIWLVSVRQCCGVGVSAV